MSSPTPESPTTLVEKPLVEALSQPMADFPLEYVEVWKNLVYSNPDSYKSSYQSWRDALHKGGEALHALQDWTLVIDLLSKKDHFQAPLKKVIAAGIDTAYVLEEALHISNTELALFILSQDVKNITSSFCVSRSIGS